jgi:peptidoglycan/xylan/chitin deacetylase (PgdA/CDA1 family)
VTDVLVLCYHAVSPSWDADLSVTPDSLERQIGFLLARGWRAATFSESVLEPPAPRTLAVTFDDAFASVLERAAPILDQFQVPATVFAPTAYMEAGSLSWPGVDHWASTPHASEMRALSWDQLGALAERGWEIASHTRTHPRLTGLDDGRLSEELTGSREDLLTHLGRTSDAIAYPYGDVDARVARSAERAGYRAGAALSSRLARLGPLRAPRVGIYNADAWWRFRCKSARTTRLLRASRLWPGPSGA